MTRHDFERDQTQLSYYDLGGSGPPILLLHGLAGHAGEWEQSARLLRPNYHVFALDQRGHGKSTRQPRELSRDAFVEDCAATIRHIELGPVALVGQSMGANTAILTAAAHPDLIRSLTIIEGSPEGPDTTDPNPKSAHELRESLATWPIPFADEATAQSFFKSKALDPDAWTASLDARADGLWPRWHIDTLVACIADLHSRNYWAQWRAIQCPTLVVLGEHGMFPHDHGNHIVQQSQVATLVTIPDAGHNVHLDAPHAWVTALRRSRAR
jgi:pimeloyl-ACP methyl ester carboxylesterase